MKNHVYDIGSRRELLVDDFFAERLVEGACLQLHHPIPREAVLVTDKPWEGCMGGFPTVTETDSGFRLYYRGCQIDLDNYNGTNHRRPVTMCR